jgi:hypothetical protein
MNLAKTACCVERSAIGIEFERAIAEPAETMNLLFDKKGRTAFRVI